MSADLLAAFGNAAADNSESVSRLINSAKLEFTSRSSTLRDEGGDTWQPWPTSSRNGPNARYVENDTQLWAEDGQGQNVLFDAAAFELDRGFEVQEDDFGEFEDANVNSTSVLDISKRDMPQPGTVDLLHLDNGDEHSGSRVSGFLSSSILSAQVPVQKARRISLEKADDDWGGFEDATSPRSKSDILAMDYSSGSHSNTHHSLEVIKKPVPKKAEVGVQAHEAEIQRVDDFDAWDEFDDVGMPPGGQDKKVIATAQASQRSTKSEFLTRERPMNIPPPAVLLSLFPRVFSELSKKPPSTDAPEDLGTQIVEAYKVCARTIAGRSLRWKRDTILAQSMRIGAAGRSGGMKLTTLDKGESRKEDQEAEEAIASWSRCSLRLNAAMVRAKVQKPPMSLSTNLVVKTAAGPDVLTASHICPICGLRRNERLNGVDINVLDTFGDFWVEHWGHKGCCEFWYRHNSLLNQR